jgi:nicotinamidase-related amidase
MDASGPRTAARAPARTIAAPVYRRPEMKSLQAVHVHRDNALLLVVDVQNRNCHPRGESYDELKARVVPAAVGIIADLLARARGAAIPVVYVQSVRTLDEPEFTVFGAPPSKRIGTWDVEILDDVRPRPGERVVQKFSHDAFFRTRLDDILEELVPDPTRCFALVVGGATNLCVYHAVLGLHLRNYWTIVVTDGVFCRGEAARERALEQFSDRSYPNIILSRSDLVHCHADPTVTGPPPVPGR